jgi:hypothetical protein
MKKIVLLLFLICPAFAQTVKTTGAWMPVDVKWEQAPPEVNARLETAQTRVLYFRDGGNLAVFECVMNREAGRYMTISWGDGQLVFTGEWDGQLPGEVEYRLVSRTVALEGEKLPGPWQQGKLKSANKGYLMFDGKLYRQVNALSQSSLNLLRSTLEVGWK